MISSLQPVNHFEELTDPVEDERFINIDFYVDRPPTPEFKPLEPGIDVECQVEDYELFDFDIEVESVL